MNKCLVIGIMLFFVVMVSPTRAATLATDSFESYTIGNLEDDNGSVANGGIGWADTWNVLDAWRSDIQVVDHAMSYTNGSVNVSGGSQSLRITGRDAIHAPLSRAFASQSDTLYMSFLLEAPTISSNTGGNTINDFFQFGFDTNSAGTGSNIRASGGIADNSSQQQFFTRYGTSAGNSTFGPAVNPSATNLLVLKIEMDSASVYNRVRLFINPDSIDEGTQSSVVFTSGNTEMSDVNNWLFRLARHETLDTYYLDSFTLADSFESVIIPEPATLTLLGLGAIGMILRRRRLTS